MTKSLDTDAIASAITDTTPSIESTTIEVTLDGLTHSLYVRPVLSTTALTSSELDAVLRTAYEASLGAVQTIEVYTVDGDDEPLDVKTAAIDLGIHHLDHVYSVSYSTEFLKKAYGA